MFTAGSIFCFFWLLLSDVSDNCCKAIKSNEEGSLESLPYPYLPKQLTVDIFLWQTLPTQLASQSVRFMLWRRYWSPRFCIPLARGTGALTANCSGWRLQSVRIIAFCDGLISTQPHGRIHEHRNAIRGYPILVLRTKTQDIPVVRGDDNWDAPQEHFVCE